MLLILNCQLDPITEGKKRVQSLNYENFEMTVEKGNKTPFFIFFKMEKCGHCRHFEPVFYKLAYDLKSEPVQFAINDLNEDSK